MIHSQLRAEERYNLFSFKPNKALNSILNNQCIFIKEDYDKYSKTFLIRYFNKYIIVVTDFNLNFVKTVLPPPKNYLNYLDKLLCLLDNTKEGKNEYNC